MSLDAGYNPNGGSRSLDLYQSDSRIQEILNQLIDGFLGGVSFRWFTETSALMFLDGQVDAAKDDMNSYFAKDKKLNVNSYTVNTQDELLNATSSVNETMTALLGGIASISLIVAVIGVMNVMLVSVA